MAAELQIKAAEQDQPEQDEHAFTEPTVTKFKRSARF
jgi:hypothetical protein